MISVTTRTTVPLNMRPIANGKETNIGHRLELRRAHAPHQCSSMRFMLQRIQIMITRRLHAVPPPLPLPLFIFSRVCVSSILPLVGVFFHFFSLPLPPHGLSSNQYDGLMSIWFDRRAEGVGGLYRGVGAVVVGGVPGTCIYLTTYEATKGYLADRDAAAGGGGSAASSGGGGALAHLTAGMIAEIVW